MSFSGDEQCLEVTLRPAAITESNMQDNDSAFEAWILAIVAWCDVASVTIKCEMPESDARRASKHYQRALYRLQRFSELMNGLVTVHPPELFLDSKITNCLSPTLNVALGKDTARARSSIGSESEIEKEFKRTDSPARNRLMKAFELTKLDRQFPVGLFDGEPRRDKDKDPGIFTGGKSAIDLIGLDRNNGIWIFELKRDGNVAVGALSELLFYSAVLRDAQGDKPAFKFSTRKLGARAEVYPEDVRGAARIHARLLLNNLHPLLNNNLFALLNKAASQAGWAIDYGRVNLGDYWPA